MAPFHVEEGIKLLGQPLFRAGASAFLLNSGLHTTPAYFEVRPTYVLKCVAFLPLSQLKLGRGGFYRFGL